jgi:energy-coupling factor transporter ATP-binding protein EcfA2
MSVVLGDLLVKENLISVAQRDAALARQKTTRGRLGEVLIELGYLSAEALHNVFHQVPLAPRTITNTGLSELFLIELMLKIAYFSGQLFSAREMCAKLCLAQVVVDTLADAAKKDRLIEVRSASGPLQSSYIFALTDLGRERAEMALQLSQYAGPAPVTLAAYTNMVEHQTVRQIDIDADWVSQAMSGLDIGDALLERLGPAFNSGRSIFIYGPPGTGKSSVAEAMGRALPGEVFVPHAIIVDEQIIRLYDPTLHVLIQPDAAVNAAGIDTVISKQQDLRWQRCRRPVVMVGGELTLDSLNLEYDPVSKFYEGPPHMKAANGLFIIDDFGRQQVPVRQLLNRWIVPLERGTDFLKLHTGKTLEIPFDQITVFCTNMNPAELVDLAFLRRIRHKILIPNQTEAEFIETLQRVCVKQGISFDANVAAYLIKTYYTDKGRAFTGSHPRDLVEQIIDRARFRREFPVLTEAAVDAAAANYFVEM